MNFISSAAEQLAYGAAQVLQQAGVQDDFVQVTVNGEAMGIEMIRKDQVIMDCGTFTPATAAGAIRLLVEESQKARAVIMITQTTRCSL